MVNRSGNRRGMHSSHVKGEQHPHWNGGRPKDSYGYRLVRLPDHPHANSRGYVKEHILLVEDAIGKRLPPGAVIHHVDGNRANNADGNLVVCQDQAYHFLLHRRMDALKACGNANWMRCKYCSSFDDPSNLYVYPDGRKAMHLACGRAYKKKGGKVHGHWRRVYRVE